VKESEEEPMSLNDRRFTNVLLVVIAVVLFVGLVLPTEASRGTSYAKNWGVASMDSRYPEYSILKVRGGWLVSMVAPPYRQGGAVLTFIPDPEHKNRPIPVD
jgi:hypothetical protein